MPEVALGAPTGRARWEAEHNGRRFLVLQHAGEYRVYDALCPHRQGRLVEGVVRGDTLVCPSHWYTFDLNSGGCRTSPDFVLRRYPSVLRDGVVYADIPPLVTRSWSEILRAHAAGD